MCTHACLASVDELQIHYERQFTFKRDPKVKTSITETETHGKLCLGVMGEV